LSGVTRPGRGLAPADIPALLSVGATAVVVEVGLRVTTLPRLARLLGCPLALEERSWEADPADAGPLAIRRLPAASARRVRATRRILRHWPFGDTCLRQALISGAQLRRLHPTLHVGVAKSAGEVRAHAWLVIDGAVLDPLGAASSYLSLTSVPPGLRNE
jgi:hypothetical protein